METQKIVNLLGDTNNESSKFATRKWYVINDQNNTDYGGGDENGTTIKFETKVIKSNLCDYSDAYIIVTGNITATGGGVNDRIAFKNCAPFTKCITHINDEHVDNADNRDIIMPMYNLIEYSDNYSDTSGSLWQFKRDESPVTNAGDLDNVSTTNSTCFKYKSSFIKEFTAVNNNRAFENVKTAVLLNYLSNFWRSLEMPLINCKIHLELNWSKDCVMSTIADTTFKTMLYVPIVTLSSKDNVKLVKLLEEGFKRPVYWNEYQTKIETRNLGNNNFTRFPLDASFQGVRRLFVLAFNNTTVNVPNNPINNTNNRVLRNSHTKYFLPRVNITNYNVLIDGRNFYDQPINDLVKQYDEIRKTATGQGDDYTTGCLLDYQYFKDHYNLIAVDLSKQKELDADSRAIQQIEFYGMLKTKLQVCIVLEKSKETMVEFYKGTAKVL